MNEKSTKPALNDAKTGYLIAGLVLAFSLFVGLFVLPYVGAERAEASPLVGQPAPDFLLPYASPAYFSSSQSKPGGGSYSSVIVKEPYFLKY